MEPHGRAHSSPSTQHLSQPSCGLILACLLSLLCTSTGELQHARRQLRGAPFLLDPPLLRTPIHQVRACVSVDVCTCVRARTLTMYLCLAPLLQKQTDQEVATPKQTLWGANTIICIHSLLLQTFRNCLVSFSFNLALVFI